MEINHGKWLLGQEKQWGGLRQQRWPKWWQRWTGTAAYGGVTEQKYPRGNSLPR